MFSPEARLGGIKGFAANVNRKLTGVLETCVGLTVCESMHVVIKGTVSMPSQKRWG